MAGEEAVLLREFGGEEVGAGLGGLLESWVAVCSVCLFAFRPDWDAVFFAYILGAIVETHLVEVIGMERIQVHLLLFLLKLITKNQYPPFLHSLQSLLQASPILLTPLNLLAH